MTEIKLLEVLKALAEHCDGMESQHEDYHGLGEHDMPRRSRPLVQAYTAIEEWESRPAAGAEPEVVEAACREICKMRGHGADTLHWHTEWETDRANRPWPQDALLSNGKPAHYGWRTEAPYVEAVIRALLSASTDSDATRTSEPASGEGIITK